MLEYFYRKAAQNGRCGACFGTSFDVREKALTFQMVTVDTDSRRPFAPKSRGRSLFRLAKPHHETAGFAPDSRIEYIFLQIIIGIGKHVAFAVEDKAGG